MHLLEYSPKNQTLISGSWDRSVRLWKPFQKQRNQEVVNMVDRILDLRLETSEDRVLVGTLRNEVHIINIETGNIQGLVDVGKYVNSTISTAPKALVKY